MKTILIVEDHADMRELLTSEVKLMGYSPVAVETGKQALEKAVSEQPDLILLDIMMPLIDGRETARALRNNPQTKGISILAATALFCDSDLQSCLDAGCNEFIVKPFTFKELKAKICELIGDRTC